jgi:FKBP-type peptidyl-prolyl cis-trans isomerase 2
MRLFPYFFVGLSLCQLVSPVSLFSEEDKKEARKVAVGDTVTLAYVMKVRNVIVESSELNGPLEFTVGKGEVIPGLEKYVTGMSRGEFRSFTVSPENAYGARTEPEKVIPKNQLPPGVLPEEKMILVSTDEQGEKRYITIKEVRDSTVVVDFNHPLAGRELYFEVEVLDIR